MNKHAVIGLMLILQVFLTGCVFTAEVNPQEDVNASDENNAEASVVTEPQTIELAVIGEPSAELKAILDSESAKGEGLTYDAFQVDDVSVESLNEYSHVLVIANPVTRGVTQELKRSIESSKTIVIVRDGAYLERGDRYAWDVLNSNNYLPVQTLGRAEATLETVSVEGKLKRNPGTLDFGVFSGHAGRLRDWNLTQAITSPQSLEIGLIFNEDGGTHVAIIIKPNQKPIGTTAYLAFEPEEDPVIFLNLLSNLR